MRINAVNPKGLTDYFKLLTGFSGQLEHLNVVPAFLIHLEGKDLPHTLFSCLSSIVSSSWQSTQLQILYTFFDWLEDKLAH
jgi:hypothetical protein